MVEPTFIPLSEYEELPVEEMKRRASLSRALTRFAVQA
jgi:hypothetical protein